MTTKELVLNRFPKAVCNADNRGGGVVGSKRIEYTVYDPDSGMNLGPTSLDSEAEAWEYAAHRLNLIRSRSTDAESKSSL